MPVQEVKPLNAPLIETVIIGSDTRREGGVAHGLLGGGWLREVRQDTRDFWIGRAILRQFVGSTLKVRYQNSVLGLLWTLLHPMCMLGIMSVVFGHVLRFDMPNYPVFLFAGLVPWQFFSASVGQGSMTLINQQGLIRKVNVRLFQFPLADVAIAATHNLIAFVTIFAIALAFGARPTEHLVLVPAGLAFLYLFTIGAVLVAMTATTYFRDMEHIIGVAMQALYFATPIFFPAEQVPQLKRFIELNPLSWIFAFFQDGIYYHRWPDAQQWLVAAGVSVGMFVLGYVVYKKHEYEFIFRL